MAGKTKLESNIPVVRFHGLNTDKAVDFSGAPSVALPATTSTSTTTTGTVTAKSGTTVPASAGAVAAGAPVTMFSNGPSLYVTSDVPAFSAVKGSICVNTAGSSTSTRLYVNNGTTNWVAITTAS